MSSDKARRTSGLETHNVLLRASGSLGTIATPTPAAVDKIGNVSRPTGPDAHSYDMEQNIARPAIAVPGEQRAIRTSTPGTHLARQAKARAPTVDK
jgi:hypothetical protein